MGSSQVSQFSLTGVKRAIINKAFDGNSNLWKNMIVTTASPDGTATGDVGWLCWDETGGDAYICTKISTTWVKINA